MREYLRKIMVLALAVGAAASAESPRRHAAYDQMVAASRQMQMACRSLYFHKISLGLEVDSLDPNRTGVIGIEYSSVTSTMGSLRAKRTAANPDFAAYIVRELVDHGYTSEDTVLVTMTGSFPGMNLAVLYALEALGIPSVRISSLGASSYGANQENFTWLDMEDVLVVERKLEHRSDFVTLGATGDVGGGLPEQGKVKLRQTAERLGYDLTEARSLRKQSDLRRKLLGSPSKYKLLINIGGNQAMLGRAKQGRELPGGWIEPRDFTYRNGEDSTLDGIVFDFLAEDIPVLNLLHIEDIANGAGIPVDPQPLPKIGESPVYYDDPSSVTR